MGHAGYRSRVSDTTPGPGRDDPFGRPSSRPFGLPPFEEIRNAHLEPAFAAGMAAQLAEVAVITATPEPAGFTDTVDALERCGALLTRVGKVFDHLLGADSTPDLRRLEADLAPRRAAHTDALLLDAALFARLDDLWSRRVELELSAEQVAVLARHRTDRVRAGAGLAVDAQRRLRELNAEIAALESNFRTKLLEETTDLAVPVRAEDQLAGLAPEQVDAAAAAAADGGRPGWLLPLVLPTPQPVLADLLDRGLREQVFRAATVRGMRGGDHDTRATLTDLVRLRAARADLLGAASHADWVVADQTAGSVETVLGMLAPMVPAVVANARREQDRLAAALAADGVLTPFQPWDWAHYAARADRTVDSDNAAASGTPSGTRAPSLHEWLELDRVYEHGVFAAATALYGLGFTARPELATYHPDVRVFEVRDDDGTPRGLFLLDPFARPSKRGGAWMDTFVDPARELGAKAVVVNVLNIARPPAGRPALLSPEEVVTAFHEFGHALHGLLSDTAYPSLSGTAVPRDFVEFPSQVNEIWLTEPTLVDAYARHHRTGEALPEQLREQLTGARSRTAAYDTAEMLGATLLDLAWHRRPAGRPVEPGDVESFEAAALAEFGLELPAVPPRYRSSYFNHIFGGGYAASYYSYLWSEVFDADTEQWFAEHGGMTRANGERFRREILSRGGTVDPLAAYRAFRGADASTGPLLRRLGLTETGAAENG